MRAERVLVFARAPVPGQVKTRLIPRFGPGGAARLHEAFLRDVLATVLVRAHDEVVLYHDPEAPGPVLERLGVALRPQRGSDLGERMVAAFEEQEMDGVEHVVLIGADSPDLPPERIAQAFGGLREVDLVLGPAVDGGFYLIGARSARGVPRGALAGVPWGSAEVLAAVLRNLGAGGPPARLLDVWYDVDRPEDVAFLRTHLDFLLETRGEDRCPATRQALDALL